MSIEKLLHEEIKSEFECLKDLEAGEEQYTKTIDGLVKLLDRSIEIDRINIEYEEKTVVRDMENDLKLKQMEEERKDRKIRNGISVAGIVLPLAVTIWGTLKSFKFEQEGTVTTIMGRGFINKLLPKK